MTKEFDGQGEQCQACGKPIGPLHRAEHVDGKWRHAPPCPEPARPTGERAFPFLPEFPPATFTSTGGITHKQHRDRNTTLPRRQYSH